MGTKWLIEDMSTGIPHWWAGSGWTTIANEAMMFTTETEASAFLSRRKEQAWKGSPFYDSAAIVTEHMFMSPIEITEKLN